MERDRQPARDGIRETVVVRDIRSTRCRVDTDLINRNLISVIEVQISAVYNVHPPRQDVGLPRVDATIRVWCVCPTRIEYVLSVERMRWG